MGDWLVMSDSAIVGDPLNQQYINYVINIGYCIKASSSRDKRF